MKKRLLVLLAITSVLLAKTPYEEASEAFKAKNYQQAFNIFDEHKNSYFSNTLYNYYFGVAAYNIGKYKAALSAFERILFDNPDHHYAKMQLGKTYYKLKMYEDARNEFEDLLKDTSFPDQVKPQIVGYIAQIEKSIKNSQTDVTFGVGVYYDSNIDQVPEADKIFIPLLQTNVSSSEVRDDFYHQELFGIKHTTGVFGRSNWTLSNSFFILNKRYFKEKSENILYASYHPSLSYKADNYKGELALQAIKTYKDDKMYSSMLAITPSIDFLIFDTVKTTLEASYFIKRHDGEKKQDYDSDAIESSIEFSNIPIKRLDTSWRFAFGQEFKKHDNRTDISNRYGSAQLYIFAPLSTHFFTKWINRYQRKNYLDFNQFFENKRIDDIFSSTFSLLYQPAPDFVGELTFSYQQNNSNQALYNYKKHSIGLNFYKMLSY